MKIVRSIELYKASLSRCILSQPRASTEVSSESGGSFDITKWLNVYKSEHPTYLQLLNWKSFCGESQRMKLRQNCRQRQVYKEM